MAAKRSNKHGLYKRDRYWWITRDPVDGKARSTKCTTLKAAQAVLAERERCGADPAYSRAKEAKLGDHCEKFAKAKKAVGRSSATIGFYGDKLGHWLRIFGKSEPLATFADPKSFDHFVEVRRDEGATEHTISKEVRVFIQVLRMAARVNDFAVKDFLALKPIDLQANYVPRNRAMTGEEVLKLKVALNAGYKHMKSDQLIALMDVSIALGLRLSEALKIGPGDIDLNVGLATVRGTKTKDSDRRVPIVSCFREMLEAAMPFLPIGSQPNNIYRNLESACRRAGIQRVSPNDWRRTHATILAEFGVDPDHTRRLLGHTSTAMVNRVYSQPNPLAIGRQIESAIKRSSGVAEQSENRTSSGE